MKRATGIGELFFNTDDPKATKEWYKMHLGLNTDDWGCTFQRKNEKGEKCSTQWSPFDKKTRCFEPSIKDFMFNYRVANLEALLIELKKGGAAKAGEMQEFDYGKFTWIFDNEGNKIELWEPIDSAFE